MQKSSRAVLGWVFESSTETGQGMDGPRWERKEVKDRMPLRKQLKKGREKPHAGQGISQGVCPLSAKINKTKERRKIKLTNTKKRLGRKN